jgi:hypothetical protein
MLDRFPEITSAKEFVRLRTSEDPREYERAAWAEMPLAVWWELIEQYPAMRFWAAHNKTVPAEILMTLADDPDWQVRHMAATKKKASPELLEQLAGDENESVRMVVAGHLNTPEHVLVRLLDDPWEKIRVRVQERLGAGH